MGSVTVIFLVPIMLFVMLIGTISGGIKGDYLTEVELPYDPSNGVVWEYDGVDDPLFDLVETEIEGKKQIFTFKGISMKKQFEENVDSDTVMYVVFTDENGNELLYYAKVNHDYVSFYNKIEFYSPDEYVIAEYTPEEVNHVDGVEWYVWGNSKNIYAETVTDGKKTFSFLYLPDKTGVSENYYTEKFYYMIKATENTEDVYYEMITVEFKAEVGKYEISDEERLFYHEEEKTLYYGDGWVKYNPALLE